MVEIAWLAAGVVVSALVGIGGVLVGVAGHRVAKEANGRAKAAVVAAEEANGIARAANKISEEANAIARVAAGEQGEDWHVDFGVDWDADLGALLVRNRGRDAAHDVSVVVAGVELHHTAVLDRLDAGQTRPVELLEIPNMRVESLKVQQAQFDRLLEVGVVGSAPNFRVEVTVALVCASPLGRVRRQEERLSIT